MTYEEYELLIPGAFLESAPREYWIKPQQDADKHFEGFLINLIDGSIIHFSILDNLIEINPHEIIW